MSDHQLHFNTVENLIDTMVPDNATDLVAYKGVLAGALAMTGGDRSAVAGFSTDEPPYEFTGLGEPCVLDSEWQAQLRAVVRGDYDDKIAQHGKVHFSHGEGMTECAVDFYPRSLVYEDNGQLRDYHILIVQMQGPIGGIPADVFVIKPL